MNSDDIARYLIEHPKFLSTFFAENPALLEAVRVPHPHTGSAISLAERQTLALRDKTRVLEGKLGELISFGEENDAISDKVHRLAVSLLAADDYSAAVRVLYQQMHEDFVVEHVALRLWGRDLPVGAPEAIACNDEQRAYIDTIGGPQCGPSANNPLRTVFGDQAETLASMAVVARSPALGALVVGGVAGGMFVVMFTLTQNRWRIDDVLGVWPLHGLCGAWGGVACGIFGMQALGGIGGISLGSQLVGTGLAVAIALTGGFVVYGALRALGPLRLTPDEEFAGADLSIHQITATPESDW